MKSKHEIVREILEAAAKLRKESQDSCVEPADEDESIKQVLRRRLPDVEVVTCDDLNYLQVECCEICHTFDPEIELAVVPLLDGRTGWLCCAIKAALIPDRSMEPNPVMDAWLQWGKID